MSNGMAEIIKEYIMGHYVVSAFIIGLCFAAIVGGMAVDLITGVRKARQNGEATTSQGLKKTAAKAQKYFAPFLVVAFVDLLITSAGMPVPIFSILWSAYCLMCEFKSVREKSWQKAEIRSQEKTMRVILENKDDIARMLAELLKRQEEENKG